jgi:hypothetical protein
MRQLLLASLTSLLLLGCGTATFEPANVKSDYRGKMDKVTVILDTTTMEEAFMFNSAGSTPEAVKKRDTMSSRYVAAVAAIQEGLVNNFKQTGVEAIVHTARTRAEVSAQANEVQSAQVMTARVSSYKVVTQYGARFWDGSLAWDLAYYDRSRANNPSTGVVWRTKTDYVLFNAGCDNDFKACGDRFGRSIVGELKRVELIAKK